MIKICSKLLTLSLKLIFNSMLQKSVFPENCKKYNAVPISKKDSICYQLRKKFKKCFIVVRQLM